MPEIDPALFAPSAIEPETVEFNRELERSLAELPPTHLVPVEETRAARDAGRGIFPPGGPLEGSDWRALAGGRRVRLSPADGAPRGIYLHIHGGGWSLGRPSHYDRHNQTIAAEAGATVVSAEYRLAPEHRWPAQIEDLRAAFDWVRAEYPGLPIVLGGESAGAHLAACLLIELRAHGRLDRIAGVCLNYGMYDLRMTASVANWGPRQLILSTPTIAWFVANLVPDAAGRAAPAVSPLLADLSGMPPALFQIGTEDPLIDDSLMMAARWAGAGRQAELAIYPGGVHAFDNFDLAIAARFRARQIEFIAGCL
ncbi:MAG: alpha/beta hydrolase [Alphaproteobacteria bacterium]|nr:MAG: alpha/beta hydrolase [Alphaproteobacteria bacterium]